MARVDTSPLEFLQLLADPLRWQLLDELGQSDRRVGELSGGERQRLAMAVAFLPDAELYLFDEPSANLDPAASRILFQRARELKREGRTLLFTTHVPADVRQLVSSDLCLLREACCVHESIVRLMMMISRAARSQCKPGRRGHEAK